MSFNCRIHGGHHIQSGCPICYQMSMQSGSASTPLHNHYPVVTHDACQAENDRLKQAVECYREALQGMCEDWFDMPPETQAKYIGKPKSHIAREALERGDAILKGEDAEKEDGK